MSNLLEGKAAQYMQITNISKNDEIFLKEFSRDFYQIIVNINDWNTFEITLSEWINDINKNTKTILELLQKK